MFLGAPEYLAPGDEVVSAEVEAMARSGQRVVLFATGETLTGEELPAGLVPLALVALEDEVRQDAAAILEYFSEQGVDLKVISGDHPATVAAVARRAGVPGAETGTDARTLPTEPDELGEALEDSVVLGRVTPRQKQAMVAAQQSRGHVVAMTGDGVNDVLALKDADMGIAMGAGSAATRAVAQLVLLDNRFSVLPVALAEGRRVINSVERAANLFVYGTVYSIIISLVVSVLGVEFPFLPRHLTLVRTLSVGIPGFFLALAPDPRRARAGFLPRVVRFAVPAGAIAAAGALTVYLVGLANAGHLAGRGALSCDHHAPRRRPGDPAATHRVASALAMGAGGGDGSRDPGGARDPVVGVHVPARRAPTADLGVHGGDRARSRHRSPLRPRDSRRGRGPTASSAIVTPGPGSPGGSSADGLRSELPSGPDMQDPLTEGIR